MAHILLIEDYRDNRDVTELILADAGHTVVSARDGAAGLRLAARAHPDLILMDLALPVLDGWEATRRLKANPCTCHIPVVAFTAQVDEVALSRAMAAGCTAVISKPFELEDLLDNITCVLARHRAGARQPAARQ
jgi:CheY-like chemotaxis protein